MELGLYLLGGRIGIVCMGGIVWPLYICAEPNSQLPLRHRIICNSHHRRYGFLIAGNQAVTMVEQKDKSDYKGYALIAIHKPVVAREPVRIGGGQISEIGRPVGC